jgi:hypothetical protein
VSVEICERRKQGFLLTEMKSTLHVKQHLAEGVVQVHVARSGGLTTDRAEVMLETPIRTRSFYAEHHIPKGVLVALDWNVQARDQEPRSHVDGDAGVNPEGTFYAA